MEVNRDAAEQSRDMGAVALRAGQYPRAVKLLRKSLNLYPLPGVKALLTQAEHKLAAAAAGGGSSSSSNGTSTASTNGGNAAASNSSSSSSSNNGNMRAHTPQQAKIVSEILQAAETSARGGGPKPHYRVLGVPVDADENQIKKAYRKLAVKVHPDKNSAPKADEAFKAVGLAYATLSDPQKRTIYDRYGEADPDNTAAARNPFAGRRGGQEVSPEDIFNMFFNGGMPGGAAGGFGGPGFRVYTNGNGFHFGGPGAAFGRRDRGMGGGGQQQQRRQEPQSPLQQFFQLLPILLLMFLSFFNFESSDHGSSFGSGGVSTSNQYFSLTQEYPYVNKRFTRLVNVKEIPFYVTDKFLRTYARDRYSLGQVERMVETTYEKYLRQECREQRTYKRKLELDILKKYQLTVGSDETEAEERTAARERELKKAREFQLTRCNELESLFESRGR